MKSLNDIFSDVDHVLNSAKHGNFEEVLTKTKSYAEKASKKSQERIELSRKRIELLDAKTKLSKAYEAYGRLNFEAYSGESVDEEELLKRIQEIQLQKSRADILDDEIAALREVVLENLTKKERRAARKKSDSDIFVDAETAE